jgi:phosphoglycerate dehydrogenase-like enzyme
MSAGSDAVLWVPPGIAPEHRTLMPADVAVREIPVEGGLPESLGRADMLVPHVSRHRLREVLPRLDGLRVIQTLSAGVDYLDGMIPDGVVLCDAAGVHDIGVSEWVLAAILAVNRELPRYVRQQEQATWKGFASLAAELCGSRVLIVGHGSIGRAVEQRLRAFGAHVTGVARQPRPDDGVYGVDWLGELLPQADVVVILLPLTAQTRGTVDASFIAQMKPGALLVNAGRGAVADTEAITEAVLAGRIRAALDVVDPEPLPSDHPLWLAPGALITPHIAGTTARFIDRGWELVAAQLRRYLAGEPLLNVVTDGY